MDRWRGLFLESMGLSSCLILDKHAEVRKRVLFGNFGE
jgi:hypothetical protein